MPLGIGKLWGRWQMYRKASPFLDKLEEAVMAKQWRKALAAAIGVAVSLLGPSIGLGPEQVKWIVEALMAYIVGQGIADFGKNAKQVG